MGYFVQWGVYARDYFRTAGVWESVAGKVVPAGNVRAALRAVEVGTADAGVVYRTDAATSEAAVVAFTAPLDGGPSIVYPAALAVDPPNPEGAARFLDYLGTRAAGRRFEAAGFISLRAAAEDRAE